MFTCLYVSTCVYISSGGCCISRIGKSHQIDIGLSGSATDRSVAPPDGTLWFRSSEHVATRDSVVVDPLLYESSSVRCTFFLLECAGSRRGRVYSDYGTPNTLVGFFLSIPLKANKQTKEPTKEPTNQRYITNTLYFCCYNNVCVCCTRN